MKNIDVLLQIAQKRAGLHALEDKGSKILLPLAIAVGVVLVFLFSFGHSEQASGLVILFGAIVLSIPIKFGITYFFARKNPELVSKELEEIAHDQETLLQLYEISLAQNETELHHVSSEGAEACVKKYLQVGKDAAIQDGEAIVAATRKILTDATPQDQLRMQESFLTMRQELRESEILVENVKAAGWDEKFQEEVVAEVLRQESVARKEIFGPLVATLQSKIALRKQSLADARQLIADIAEL